MWNGTEEPGSALQVPTPALLVDADVFDGNLAAAEKLLLASGKQLRPHIKTHRTSQLALRQLGDVARGVTCATVGEAEAMVVGGVGDVLLANEIVTSSKIDRLVSLARSANVAVAIDSVESALRLADAAQRMGSVVSVLVDVDVGLRRCGAASAEEALLLARNVSERPGLLLAGIMGYEGRLRSSNPDRHERVAATFNGLAETKAAVESSGLRVPVVSSAGTSTFLTALDSEVVTEIQAGTYAFMEPDLEGLGLPFRCCVSVVATVISRSSRRVVVDAGRKAVGCEYGLPIALNGYAETVSVSEEHTVCNWEGTLPDLGDQVALRPTKVPTTFNLHDRVWMLRDGHLAGHHAIDARGRSQ